jgi:drug/metabolite transporter (DMT)-like permease
MTNRLPFVALFITTIIYGFTNVLLRYAGKPNYFSIIFLVLLFSAIMLLPVMKFSGAISQLKTRRQSWLILPLGLSIAATWLLIYFAIMNTSIANAVLGYMTTPIFVIILSPFLLKEHVNKAIAAALAIALLGVLLIFDPRNLIQSIAPIGIISGILAGFASALVEIIGRKLRHQYSPFSLTFFGTFMGAVFLFPAFLVTGLMVPDSSTLLLILLMAIGGLSGGTLVYYGLKYVLAQSVSIILLLEPFISIAAAYVLFLEVPSWLTILGAVLLLIADLVIIRSQP